MSEYHYCKRILAPSGQRQYELLPVYGVCYLFISYFSKITDPIWSTCVSLGWPFFRITSERLALLPRWPPLLKNGISLNGQSYVLRQPRWNFKLMLHDNYS